MSKINYYTDLELKFKEKFPENILQITINIFKKLKMNIKGINNLNIEEICKS